MESQMRLSVEKFVNLVTTKLGTRLNEVAWGDNCYDVREALKFDEELFIRDMKSDEEKNAFLQFLMNEGFQPKKTRINGVYKTEWFYALNPKTPEFVGLRKAFEQQYKEFLENSKVRVEQIVMEFIESEDYCKFYVIDGVQNKVLHDEVVKYNQSTIIFNNRRNANYQRPFIIDVSHPKYPITLLFKQKEDKVLLEEAEQAFLEEFWKNFYDFLFFVNTGMRYANINKGKMFAYVNCEYARQYKELFESLGVKVSFFSTYSKSEYVDIMQIPKDNEHVMIFMEIIRPLALENIFQQVTHPIKAAINEEYKKFCTLVNMKVDF